MRVSFPPVLVSLRFPSNLNKNPSVLREISFKSLLFPIETQKLNETS